LKIEHFALLSTDILKNVGGTSNIEWRKNMISDVTKLANYLKSQRAALIFAHLERAFSQKDCKEGFYKFYEPCKKHPFYQAGDSWSEEIGFSRKVFRKVFALIGNHYSSKAEFYAQKDPFQGKFFASYYERSNHQTFYVRNHDLAHTLYSQLGLTKISELPGSSNKYININNKLISNVPTAQTQAEEGNIAEQMKEIWLKEVGDVGRLPITRTLLSRMCIALKNLFQGSLEKWKQYCRKIASNKFLMGEAPNTKFKAWLIWAIKPEAMERIEAGEFAADRVIEVEELKPLQSPEEIEAEIMRSEHPNAWKEASLKLLRKVGSGIFKSWLAPLIAEQQGEKIRLLTPHSFARDWIQTHLGKEIAEALSKSFVIEARRDTA
jgi:hypothetical protein